MSISHYVAVNVSYLSDIWTVSAVDLRIMLHHIELSCCPADYVERGRL